eukprot:6659397-Prorocentrum_lima.AAC.1
MRSRKRNPVRGDEERPENGRQPRKRWICAADKTIEAPCHVGWFPRQTQQGLPYLEQKGAPTF